MNLAILQPIHKYLNSTSYIANLVFYSSLMQSKVNPFPVICDRTFISEARSQIVKKVIENYESIDLCLWIDSDHQYTLKDFESLYKRMVENKLDIVSGAYLMRDDKHDKLCAMVEREGNFHWLSEESKGLIEVSTIGLGFCLMKKAVLKTMWDKYKANMFDTMCLNPTELIYKGEDVTFCQLLRDEGFKIHLDMDTKIGHYGFNLFPKVMTI